MVVNSNIDPDKLPDRTKAGWPRNNSVDNALCALRQIAMAVKRGPKRKILFKCPGVLHTSYFVTDDGWEWFSPVMMDQKSSVMWVRMSLMTLR